MKSAGRLVTKLVRLITDADTNFVSLVDHGANQQPFAFVKHADILNGEPEVRTQEETVLERPKRHDNIMMQKMSFDKSYFDETRAKQTLEHLGFSGQYDFVSEGNSYIAKSKHFNDFESSSVKMIKGNLPGVEVFVGALADATQDNTEESSVEKSDKEPASMSKLVVNGMTPDQVIEKFNYWNAYYSSGKTLAEAIEAGMTDGLPPGTDEINAAFWTVVANSIMDKDYDAVKKASQELGEMVVAIMGVIDGVTSVNKMEKSEMVDVLRKALLEKAEGEQPAAPEGEAPAEETPATEEKPAGEEAPAEEAPKEEVAKEDAPADAKPAEEAPAEEPKEETPPAETPAEEKPDGATAEGEAEGVEKSASGNDALLKAFADMLGKELAPIKTDISKVAGRVEKLEGKSATKKSVEVTDEEAAPAKTEKSAEAEEKKVFKADPTIARNMGLYMG